MSSFVSLLAGRRRAALPRSFVALAVLPPLLLLLPAPAAQAQRLLTLVSGVEQAASMGDSGSMGPAQVAVDVDLDLLRSAPWRLEAPTPDGSVLVAERSVFEDRGGGDLMWSGGQPGAGYDTVVLTVEGGHFVGRFGAAGGGVYQINARPNGTGSMVTISVGYPVPGCPVNSVADSQLGLASVSSERSAVVDSPERMSSLQNHGQLDILATYTAAAAENWEGRNGSLAAVRHAGDYLRMVFRNAGIAVVPRIVHIAQLPGAPDRVGRDVGWHENDERFVSDSLHREILWDGELLRLRHEHRVDLAHVFVGERPTLFRKDDSFVCGGATQWTRNVPTENFAFQAVGYTMNHPICRDYAATFVRQIGHGLGLRHDPGYGPDPVPKRPYAFAHANLDVMPSIGTAMSCKGQVEPFFSSPRTRPHGAVLGIAGERDNERALRELVHLGVRFSDYLTVHDEESVEDGAPAPPSNLRAELIDPGWVRLTWQDNDPDADGYEVEYYRETINNPEVRLRFGPPYRGRQRRDAVEIGLPVREPGTRYRFRVRAWKGRKLSLPGSRVTVVIPGQRINPPSHVSVHVDRRLNPVVRWADNSNNEVGFEVQLLEDGEPIVRRRWAQSGEALIWEDALPRIGAEYGVRVFAYNSAGYSESSEAATFRWTHPDAPGAPSDVAAVATGPTTVRVTWTTDRSDDRAYYRVRAELPGWSHTVDVPAKPGSWDFKGLARGGRYMFSVYPEGYRRQASATYLILGERGAGPQAPATVTWSTHDGATHLNWKDRSTDESGFVIQSRAQGAESWTRELLLPPDTESATLLRPPPDALRVFAYNERGFSEGSPAEFARRGSPPDEDPDGEDPDEPPGSCKADSRTLCLLDSRFSVGVEWTTVDGRSGVGYVVPEATSDSGLFRFFGRDNWEILIKVLDGCAENGHMWVLGASTTDLGYRIEVTDAVTGEERVYENEPGRPAPAIVDTKAFSMSCAAGTASP